MEKQSPILPVSEDELPSEFKNFDSPFGIPLYIFNIMHFSIAHVCTVYSMCYLLPFGWFPIPSLILGTLFGYCSGLGITVGAHRYWTHRTFKAKMPLQILLMLLQTLAGQYPIFTRCRDHRVHHKYTDTDADPHSAARGFWFSHILWNFTPKHPEYLEKRQIIQIADLANDPVVRFQSKYYWQLILLIFFLVPMTICHLVCPGMSWFHVFLWNMSRYCWSLHFTFLVNSVAHIWGDKPYDKYISSTENKLVSLLAVGEGWHNYHHTFPWDYKAAELGYRYNLSTVFIQFFAWIGWAYDLKTVSHKMLVDRVNRTGDGSHPFHTVNENISSEGNVSRTCWGWGDEQFSGQDMEVTEILFPCKSG